MSLFAHDVVAVVGGSSGIGKESAKLFASRGAQVVLIARGAKRLRQTADEIRRQGGKAETIIADAGVPDEMQNCVPPFFTAYAATKHALRGFLLSLRQELGPEGIHVGMVSPGPVDTPLIEKDLHRDMYRLPPGIPVLKPEAAAKGVLRTVIRRKKDFVVPARMALAARIGCVFPALVETYYRLTIPGWNKRVQSRIKRPTV